MPALTNPWVLTAGVILSVIAVFMVVRTVHRLKHGKMSTEFAPLPTSQPMTDASHRARNDEDPLLAKGA